MPFAVELALILRGTTPPTSARPLLAHCISLSTPLSLTGQLAEHELGHCHLLGGPLCSSCRLGLLWGGANLEAEFRLATARDCGAHAQLCQHYWLRTMQEG